MVFKRILTFALAGILVFETPATAYAAEQGGWTETISKADILTVEDGADGNIDEVSDQNDGSENVGANADGSANDSDHNNGSDTGESADETGSGDDSDHSDDSDSGNNTDNDSDSNGGSDIGNTDDKDGGSDTDDSDHSDDADSSDDANNSDDGNHEDDNAESGKTEEMEDPDETSEDEEAGSISENTVSISVNALADDAEAVSEEPEVISYEDAITNGVTISAPDSREGSAWYSFTAPKAGRYAFYTDNIDCEGTGYIYVNLCTAPSAETKNHWAYFDPREALFVDYFYLWLSTDYMEAGETVYVETYVEKAAGRTFTMKVADQTEGVTDGNGARSLTFENGDRIAVRTQAGCERLRFDAEVEYADTKNQGLYFIRPYWCPADHSQGDLDVNFSGDITERDILLGQGTKSEGIESKPVAQKTAYEVSYLVLYASKGQNYLQFAGLLSGEQFTTKERAAAERVCILDAVCTDHTITLELEPFSQEGGGDRAIRCYYAPTDGSEPEKSVLIDQYKQYKFTGLRAGTEYRFDFRTSQWAEAVQSVTYATTGEPVEINVYEYKITVSEEFQDIAVRAKTNYQGDGSVWLYGSVRDELGQTVPLKSSMVKIPVDEQETELRCGCDVAKYVFLPGKTYEAEIWIEFQDECITTEHQNVSVSTPEKACYGEDEITFQVTPDSEVKTTANCEFQLPDRLVSSCYIYYKPEGEARYMSVYKGLDLAHSGPYSVAIEGLQTGVEYDFVLSFGGVVVHRSLNLNESGMGLVRVEDNTTDFEGPYDFIHTYRLSGTEGEPAGDYYLQLQYVRADKWEDEGYQNAGDAVALNEENQYRTVFSSAGNTMLWLFPDTEYYLRWLVGKSEQVNTENAVCCLYEQLTTSPASPLQIEETGYMKYQVTFHEADMVNLKAYGRSKSLGAYIRKEGAQAYTTFPRNYNFTAENQYSAAVSGLNLAFNSQYELYIGTAQTKYATGILEVGDDTQKLVIDSVNALVTVAEISYTIQGIDQDKEPWLILYSRQVGSTEWKRKYDSVEEKGKINLVGLQENTEYEYVIGLGASISTPISELTSRHEGRFTTHEETRKIWVMSVKPRMADVSITCSLSGMGNSAANDKYVKCWCRSAAEGANQSRWSGHGVTIGSSDTKVEFNFNNLEKETVYEYRIGFGDVGPEDLAAAIEGTFTTTPDMRKAVVTVAPGIYKAELECAISGVEDSGYLIGYLREDTEEGTWRKADSKSIKETDSLVTLATDGLKENTRYQYRVGFAKSANTEADALDQPTEGEFTTNQDTRAVEVTASPMVISADITYTLSGMEHADEDYLCGYSREKTGAGENAGDDNGEETALWKHEFSVPVNNRSTGGSVKITKLKAATDYEMIVGFGGSKDCGTDQLIHTKTIEFTSLEDMRKVSGAKADVKETGVILSALFEGNMEPQPSYVIFFYKKKEEESWHKAGYVTNASNVESRECSTTLTGLVMDTEYEFAAVVADASSGVSDPDSVTDPNKKATGAFKTMSAVAPDSVTLLQERLYLNAGETYKNEKGYGYEELKISWSPDKITKDFVWESSNPDVAAVSKDGKVTAVAPGTAKITVTSLYNPEAADTCDVVVGNYRVGCPDGADGIKWLDGESINVVKGQRYAGYGLYDLSADAPVAITDITVLSDNETVAVWESGEIVAKQAGTAKLIFGAADSVKAYMAVNVQSVSGRGFDIIGFTASNSNYPAVQEEEKDEDRAQYTLACKSGLTYTAVGEIVPGTAAFVNSNFTWSIDNTAIAEVSEAGVVTPKAAGKAVLRVAPKDTDGEDGALYLGQTCEVTLQIKELASEQLVGATPVYALANICKKIGDVRMPKEDAWEGWQWEEPNTPIIINGVNRASYPFRAVYTGEEYYPEEKTINVYIAKVTGMSLFEDADPGHNNVIEVSDVDENGDPVIEADRLTLTVESLFHGWLNPDEKNNYFYDVDITAPANVIIQKEDFYLDNGGLYRNFHIAAVRPGSYTLTAAIKVRDKNFSHEKILAKKTYKLKAVAGKQAYVKLIPETTEDVIPLYGRIVIDSDQNVTDFNVRAELTDRNDGNPEDFAAVKIAWSVTDKKVLGVKSSADTHSAQITVKGEGHAILTAKVKDAAGHTDSLRIEVQNNAPRVNTDKVNVNLAYDYDTAAGRNLAKAASGMVEIIPAYDDSIQNVTLYNSDQKTICTDLRMVTEGINTGRFSYKMLVGDSKSTKPGRYDCYLGVKTKRSNETYFYPLTVTVKEEQAKLTVKSNRAANLFYRSEPASVDIGIKGSDMGIDSVVWESDAADGSHGFSAEPVNYAYDTFKKADNVERFYFKQGDIQLTDKNKPADLTVFTGRVKVKVQGYKEPNEGVKVTLKWNYKKPAIVTQAVSATLIPAMADHNVGRFDLYNKTDQKNLLYNKDSITQKNPKYYYSELSCDNDSVQFLPDSNTLGWRRYTYTGSKTKGTEKLTLTIRNADWREPLCAVHTVKLAAPVPYLTNPQLAVNTKQIGTAYTQIRLKNAYDVNLNCDSIMVEGGNPKAKALLADDLLEISQDSGQKDQIVVKVNRAETMAQAAIKNGTYPFKITPCYTDAYGNMVKTKPLNLKIKVTNKAVTAKVKVSGKLDLTKETATSTNYVSLKTTFQNIGSNYTIKNNIRLYGEYSNYFDLRLLTNSPGQYRIRIKQSGKLKAGQRYKLALGFTIEMENGDTFTVRSQTFTVTPKQSQPKVKILDNNQTLYAANDMLYRTYTMEVLSEGGYTINDVSGSLDCNKDGKADLNISWLQQADNNKVTFRVGITDRDGIMTVTGMKGKTYTIPVTVYLKGRDGIARDLKTNIKVTVRR